MRCGRIVEIKKA